MGAILVVLVIGVLIVDQALEPWFPFLFVVVAGLSVASTVELRRLLPGVVRPAGWLCGVGIAALVSTNWLAHLLWWPAGVSPWLLIAGVFAALVVLVFLVEMANFHDIASRAGKPDLYEPGQAVTRMALAVWLLGYLGLLPSFLAQLRWLPPSLDHSTAALALTIFVPKCGDIGAYFTGRMLGRHPMTPVLSPKKTWEGAAGGLVTAAAMATLLDRVGPAALLQKNLALELGFGISLGVAGMLGDLAESLVKREGQQKDASQAVPGFGGVLDVVDAVVFAAPVAYGWFVMLGPLNNASS
jgi:phosphatidate cytidylyltransferase